MNILITGGCGYIGEFLVKKLVKNHNIIIVDNLSNLMLDDFKDIGKTDFFKIDLKSKKDLGEVFNFINIDLVIHLAARKNVRDAQKNPFLVYKDNILGTLNLLDCMLQHNVKKFIFTSSAAVYESLNGRVSEDMKIGVPKNAYGYSKYIIEKLLNNVYKDCLDYIILRLFNVSAKEPLNSNNLIANIVKSIKSNKIFYIYNKKHNTKDNTAERDLVHVDDVIKAYIQSIKLLSKNSINKTFNIGRGKGVSVLEVLNMVSKIYKKNITIKESQKEIEEPGIIISDVEFSKTQLGWEAKKNLNDIILDSFKFHKII